MLEARPTTEIILLVFSKNKDFTPLPNADSVVFIGSTRLILNSRSEIHMSKEMMKI
jgi:hypothetical protein